MSRFDAVLFARGLGPRLGSSLTTRLGTPYGGWEVPVDLIQPGWVCYTAGVGEDASFDVELAKIGCDVIAIDPTPRAVAHMEPLLERFENLALETCALWTSDTTVDFFPPADPEHVSFSIENLQGTKEPIRVPARTLPTLMEGRGHERIDLLKLDIEGAEYDLLDSISCSDLGVSILCVEYHDAGLRKMRQAVRRILADGYRIAHARRGDVTFQRIDGAGRR